MSNPLSSITRFILDFDFGKLFTRPDIPLGLRIVNFLVLLAILPWPLLMFMSIFLFDAPSNETSAFPVLLTILFYPFPLLAFTIISFKKYKTNPGLSRLLPIFSIAIIGLVAYVILSF